MQCEQLQCMHLSTDFSIASQHSVLNAYACIMFVASYNIMKTDRAMGQLLKRVASEARTDEIKQQLRKVGLTFLFFNPYREVSPQETVYRILSLPMNN